MRSLLVVFFLLALSQYASSQNTKAPSRLAVGFSISPDYNVRLPIEYGGDFDVPNKVFAEIETPQIGVSTEVSGEYRVSSGVALQTGLRYTLRRYETTPKTNALDFYDEFSGAPPPTFNFPIHMKQLKQRHHFIGVPARINFSFGKNRLRFGFGIGATANVLVWSTNKSRIGYFDGSTKNKTVHNLSGFKRFTVTPELAGGINYAIGSNSYLKVEPTIRALIPIGYMWGFGLNLSYFKSF